MSVAAAASEPPTVGAVPPTIYYKLTEECGTVRWYSVSPFMTHRNLQVIDVIDDLLDNLGPDIGLIFDKQSSMPTSAELGDDGLRDYVSLKAFIARYTLGLD